MTKDISNHRPDPAHLKIAADRRATKAELREAYQAVLSNYMLVAQEDYSVVTEQVLPKEWYALDLDHPIRRKKKRVTLLLDEDVVKFFQLRGQGYQAYINDVLKFYAKLRLSKIIEGEEDRGLNGEPL